MNLKMKFFVNNLIFIVSVPFYLMSEKASLNHVSNISLYWWEPENGINFGDILSPHLIQRMTHKPVERCLKGKKKLLAIGSILQFAEEGDIVWGAGIGGNDLHNAFHFKKLDVRAVRGPLTRKFLLEKGISCPEIYGDPALLLPHFFPELRKAKNPQRNYIIIPHISEIEKFKDVQNVILPTEDWKIIIHEILNSKLVISGSLHGIVVAEAFGVPARLLKVDLNVRPFKYEDYYLGTKRPNFRYAKSIEEAIELGGEPSPSFDAKSLIEAFPWELVHK